MRCAWLGKHSQTTITAPTFLIAVSVVLLGAAGVLYFPHPQQNQPCLALTQDTGMTEVLAGARGATVATKPAGDEWFLAPAQLGDKQLVFQGLVYMYMLYRGAEFMGGGAELLLLVPSLSGAVGSIIIPLSGSAPEGIMVIVAGIGDREEVRERVKVGMGTIAGSIIFLLTLPWFVAIWFGRVNVENGMAQYQADRKGAKGQLSFFRSGIGITDKVHRSARSLLASSMLYGVVQFPAFLLELTMGLPGADDGKLDRLAELEGPFALAGALAGAVAFVLYVRDMAVGRGGDLAEGASLKREQRIIKGIVDGQVSLCAALSYHKSTSMENTRTQLAHIMAPFFHRYDKNRDGRLCFAEFESVMSDLGEAVEEESAMRLFQHADQDGKGHIDLHGLVSVVEEVLQDAQREHILDTAVHALPSRKECDDAEDSEDEDDVPLDLAHLPPREQQQRIVLRAAWMMVVGLILTFIFADPLVDVLMEAGLRFGVSPFYTSFILAPLTSNVTEVYTTYIFASKRSQKAIEASLSTLLGSSVLNNTFVFPLFLVIVYWRSLPWTFAAETISIVFTVSVITILSMRRRVHTPADGVLIILLYPTGLLLVWVLTRELGLD